MKTIILTSSTIILLTLFSCSKDENINDLNNIELAGKTYNHLFFDSEQACIDAQSNPDFFINCNQQLTFIDSENATIMMTDIVNFVKYNVNNKKITIIPEPNSDFSENIIFEVIDANTLKQLDNDFLWEKQTGASIWE